MTYSMATQAPTQPSSDGNDSLVGGEGNDSIHAGSGQDLIDGGTGFDFIYYAWGSQPIHHIDLALTFDISSKTIERAVRKFDANNLLLGTDTFKSIENFVGTALVQTSCWAVVATTRSWVQQAMTR